MRSFISWAVCTLLFANQAYVFAQVVDSHTIHSRFESTDSGTGLNLIFEVRPTPTVVPVVRWLGANPRHDSRQLAVSSIDKVRYLTALTGLESIDEGTIQIEVQDPDKHWFELHSVSFAIREHVMNLPASRSTPNGNFFIYSLPADVPADIRLFLTSSSLPLVALPPQIAERDVIATYTVDFMPEVDVPHGWIVGVSTDLVADQSALFFLPKGSSTWQIQPSKFLVEHAIRTTGLEGPGTWLLVRGAMK